MIQATAISHRALFPTTSTTTTTTDAIHSSKETHKLRQDEEPYNFQKSSSDVLWRRIDLCLAPLTRTLMNRWLQPTMIIIITTTDFNSLINPLKTYPKAEKHILYHNFAKKKKSRKNGVYINWYIVSRETNINNRKASVYFQPFNTYNNLSVNITKQILKKPVKEQLTFYVVVLPLEKTNNLTFLITFT